MSNRQFQKITYHLGAKNMNAYIKMPSPTYFVLKKEIEFCLFQERQQPRCDLRTYWIDDDNDEIEIVNQCDYEIFLVKSSERGVLHISPIGQDVEEPVATTSTNSESNATKVPPAAGSYEFAVHSSVECDSCLMSPIMGFRYKCIQCPNYDLCQNCESKHIHSEHMMVRMPNNACPNVVDAYITGRNSGRRHGKRSKTSSCPFVKNGISVVIDDDMEAAASTSAGENGQPPSPANGKERHHGRRHHRRQQRNNFFSHLYEMMHDLAEGGGAAAAAHAMGEADASSKTTTFNNGTQTHSSTKFTSNSNGFENGEIPIAAAAAAAAADMASQCAQDAATKAAEIAAKVASKAASNVAKNISEVIASSANENFEEKKKETTNEKVNASTTARNAEPQSDAVPVTPSPSFEGLAQFLDPQYVRTSLQIFNNFSDMFAKMLDPLDKAESELNQTNSNLQKDSVTSNKSSTSSNRNSLASEKTSEDEKSVHNIQDQENPADSSSVTSMASEKKSVGKTSIQEKPAENILSNVEIDDLGSDSENDSVSDSFVKLNVPKTNEDQTNSSTSAEATPPKSLDKSNVLDFAQLSADLKAHIAQEAKNETLKSSEAPKETAEKATATVSVSETATAPNSTTTSDDKPEEKRAVPVYHADQRINNAVLAMMSMGFSNEGAWLTQLLESVNGNISEALDVMSVAQRL